ncbi:hypothetical protein Fmac_019161 [Flemingia macrophylla]|uniref:Uncharacterized protein n=1 Tax=Flemingia macrophylla TaxID=520843 RepID=A0ABD1M8Z9_9FABA
MQHSFSFSDSTSVQSKGSILLKFLSSGTALQFIYTKSIELEEIFVVLVSQRHSVQGEVEVEMMHLGLLEREVLVVNKSCAVSQSREVHSSHSFNNFSGTAGVYVVLDSDENSRKELNITDAIRFSPVRSDYLVYQHFEFEQKQHEPSQKPLIASLNGVQDRCNAASGHRRSNQRHAPTLHTPPLPQTCPPLAHPQAHHSLRTSHLVLRCKLHHDPSYKTFHFLTLPTPTVQIHPFDLPSTTQTSRPKTKTTHSTRFSITR